MIFRLGTAARPPGEIGRMLAGIDRPQCHRCGSAARLLEILEQPVYGEQGKALAQYVCETCDVLIEELRPI